MKGHSVIWVVLVISTMLVSFIFLVPERARASTPSSVTLKLQDTPPKVDVSPGSVGIVKVDGTATCLKYGPDPVKVFLQGQSDIGAANVIPSRMVFTGTHGSEGTQQFSVITRVPKGLTSKSTPKVTISGYFIHGGLQYEIPPVTQIIEIKPYYRLEADIPPPQEIGADGFVDFKIKVTNIGNAENTCSFILMGMTDLMNQYWTYETVTPYPITFMEGETRTITVRVQGPQTQTNERNKITPYNLRITSIQSEKTAFLERYDVPLHIYQKGFSIPGFSSLFAFIGIGFVALVMGKNRFSKGEPSNNLFKHPKGLYPKLSMNMR